jgi:(R,R)-butanediol dehydrogenase / meso-butanediol dehydrogenase / diacetyl reductase
MRALRWHGRDDIRLEEITEPPPPGPDEIQLQVLWCGICGTDIEEWRHGPISIPTTPHPLTGTQAPITLGHEICGEVVDVGPGPTRLRRGDRVAVDGTLSCGTCHQCVRHRTNLCEYRGQIGLTADGGLQPLLNVPAQVCLPLPSTLAAEGGAIAETLSVGVRALRRAQLVPGERVVIFGAGAVGLLALQVARASGASHLTVVDPLPSRRRLARQLGADQSLDSTSEAAIDALDANIAIECSGSVSAIERGLTATRPSGRIVLVGVTTMPASLPVLDVVAQEKSVIGSVSHIRDEDFSAALCLLDAGLVQYEPLITRIKLADIIESGLRALAEQPERHMKILVEP